MTGHGARSLVRSGPTITPFSIAVGVFAIALIIVGVWRLEADRAGLLVERASVGTTPVTFYAKAGAEAAPLVIVTHGFAGSRPLMEPYALALAQAGYAVASFDFEGHGRNPVPMSGDVESVRGTTQLLIDETVRVMDAGLARPETDGRVAILGHSMASDIIVRTAARDDRIGTVIAISAFSQAVTETEPARFLMITGQWEERLREFAVEALRMVDSQAQEGETAQSPDGAIIRRAFVAPSVEHVGVLYSPAGIREAVGWLNDAFDRTEAPDVPLRIGWIYLVLSGTVILMWPLAKLVPQAAVPHVGLSPVLFFAALLVPLVAVPLAAIWMPRGILPVLVADYLALHM
ncbi:MAG: alpha/beta fold hydrolase, partial [Pseudomonadota bacterium]